MPDEETDVTFGDLDFDAIETAVMETARGRWFLKEYARRNRHADTQAILEAVDRLKEPGARRRQAVARLRSDLEEMAVAIRQTKEAIRSFPAIDGNDPLNALSEAELQAAAEQRIRHMVQTFHYLETPHPADDRPLRCEDPIGRRPRRNPALSRVRRPSISTRIPPS